MGEGLKRARAAARAASAPAFKRPEIVEGAELIYIRGFLRERSVVKVIRRTPTRLVVVGTQPNRPELAAVFSADSLKIPGARHSFYPERLEVPRDAGEIAAVRDEERRRALCERFRRFDWVRLSTAKLLTIEAVIDNGADPEPPA